MITETIPAMVAEDTAFRNARKNSNRENARVEHDRALSRVMMDIMKDDTELFRQFMDNPDIKPWLGGVVLEVACERAAEGRHSGAPASAAASGG